MFSERVANDLSKSLGVALDRVQVIDLREVNLKEAEDPLVRAALPSCHTPCALQRSIQPLFWIQHP